jgi:FkbM family methyltransferase
LRQHAVITASGLSVFLKLTDPRSLVVPGELATSPDVAALRELLQPGDTFVDLGANHGAFSVAASRIVGAHGLVVAVEPQTDLADLVARSLAVNCLSPFEIHAMACSDVEGTQTLYIPAETSGSAGLYEAYSGSPAARRVDVPVRRFDRGVPWPSFPGNVCVKVDVEGSELSALEGSRQFILARRPALVLELNPKSLQTAGRNLADLLETLGELGYQWFREVDDQRPLSLATLQDSRPRNVILGSPGIPLGGSAGR